MRRLSIIVALLGSVVAGPALAEVRLCLSPTQLGDVGNDRHYRYDGRIIGQTAGPADAYGIVARDAFGNVWVQHGTGQQRLAGNVSFGVRNVSSYPLTFEVVAMSKDMTAWFRNRARVGRALDENELGWIRSLPDQSVCQFALDGEEPVTQTCRC